MGLTITVSSGLRLRLRYLKNRKNGVKITVYAGITESYDSGPYFTVAGVRNSNQ